MGADSMANPEGIIRFAVDTPTKKRETDVPVLPRPIVKPVFKPPQPEKPKPTEKPPKMKKPLIQRMIGNLGVRIGLGVLAAGGAGYAAREAISDNIPALSRPAETLVPTVVPQENLFPNTLDTSSFIPITQQQAIKELKDNNIADLENHIIKIFLPVDKETLDSTSNLRYGQKFDAVLPPYVDKTKLEGVKDLIQIEGLNDGADVRAPVGGVLRVVTIAGQKTEDGVGDYTPSYSLVRIDFQDKDDKSVSLSLSVLGGEPLLDLSQAAWKSNGIRVEVGQKLFKISKTNASGGQSLQGQEGQIAIRTAYQQQNPRAPIPLTVDFLKGVIVK